MFPPIEPYRSDWLESGDGHRIHFEESGNPRGVPVLFLHGGPGSRTRPAHRRFFDPEFYRIILFDQRGCGRSTPQGSTADNTTWHLLGDMERLRVALGVPRWLLFGGSWGSTLALAYAIADPGRVAGMVLRGVFLASRDEVQWYLSGMRRFMPDAWTEFAADTGGDPLSAYARLVNHPDPQVALAAARRWCDYESRMMAIGEASATGAAPSTDEMLAGTRVQLHYLVNNCFLRPGELMDNLWRAACLPAIIVQGGMDMICPPETAVSVARHLPKSELRLVAAGGHSALQPAIADELCAAAVRMQSMARP